MRSANDLPENNQTVCASVWYSSTEDLAVYPPTSLSGFDDIVSLVVAKWRLLPPFDRYGSESRTLAGWRRTF
jgi:hypothetical protein